MSGENRVPDAPAEKCGEVSLAHRVQELELANAGLERALRVKDEFLTNMSHELRTPLTVIIGQSEILRDEIHGTLNEAQQKAVRSVESSGRHLLTLINDILDLSKLEAAMLEIYPEKVNVEMLCSSCLLYVKQEVYRKRLSIGMTLDPVVSSFEADPRRVRQMLVNLLVNAVKFTPEGGEVMLEVTGDREQHCIRFTVRDTGVGVTDDDLERLFTPFVQVGSNLNRRYEGTGLGLALVKQLARLHGGGVAVTSQVGVGSRFTVTLPWDDVGSRGGSTVSLTATLPEPDTLAPFFEAPLILVVDDSPATIEMMQGYLRTAYRVIGACSGAEAVAAASSDSPALILMDIQMPVMDGLEAIGRIRQLSGTAGRVPIIALTALAMRGDRERCLNAGADDYLSKPVSMKDLNTRIRSLLTEGPRKEQP
jgi:CheY-like chemotaxis protein/nitrogen-specific signal transduction histidine kinase